MLGYGYRRLASFGAIGSLVLLLAPSGAFAQACTGRCVGGTNHGEICLTVAECPGLGAICQGRIKCVNLEWRPSTVTVPTNGIGEVGLYAVTAGSPAPPATMNVEGLDAILDWLPARLQLMGVTDPCRVCLGGANANQLCADNTQCPSSTCGTPDCDFLGCAANTYNWFSSFFPNDCNNDSVNAPCTGGVPANDGDALYEAISQFVCEGKPADSALATPQGLLITKFRFKMLAATGGALVDILPSIGENTSTKVVGGDTPGLDVLGYIGSPAQFVVGVPCSAPTVAATGPRYISITPPAGTDPIAFQVKGSPTNALISCITRYVQAPTRLCAGGSVPQGSTACTSNANCAGGTCITTAVLGTTPAYLTPAAWNGPVQVRSEVMGPNMSYEFRSDCNQSSPGTTLSSMVSTLTWRWGDVNNSGPPVNFIDISKTVDGFRGLITYTGNPTLTMESVDLSGTNCVPNRQINFIDISSCVDSFQGNAFAFCSALCP